MMVTADDNKASLYLSLSLSLIGLSVMHNLHDIQKRNRLCVDCDLRLVVASEF